MNHRTLRNSIALSAVLGSVLLLGLAAVACSSSSADPIGSTAGSSSTLDSGGSSSAGTDNGQSCVPETLTSPSDVPAVLQTPTGTTLIHHFHAAGTQDYKCTATAGTADAGTTYSWVLFAPEAVLSDNCGNQVGTHYAGPGGAATPRWQISADGSYVQGTKLQASPVAGSIPEVLLGATESSAGALAAVSYVQRLAPVGGAAPDAADCTAENVDEVSKSGYSAEYYFYSGGASGSTY